jgi:hypothetical protein
MSTVSATGITDVMQQLSSAATPALSSLMSSSSVKTALGKASSGDIVQLSEQATQLQEVDGLFGAPAAPPAENSGMAMQALLTSIYSGNNVNLTA